MYIFLLIRKYLLKRRIAWVSLAAVALCTTMVLVVISVMGGWLRMFRQSFHGLSGDIVVYSGSELVGFNHYEDAIKKIQGVPGIEGAVPIVQTYGILKVGRDMAGVEVLGYPIDRIGQVNDFPQSLYREYQQYLDAARDKKSPFTAEQRQQLLKIADFNLRHPTFAPPPDFKKARETRLPGQDAENQSLHPGMIIGSGLLYLFHAQYADEDKQKYRPPSMYSTPATLTVVAVGEGSAIDATRAQPRAYWVTDDSHTGLWQYDSRAVYVPFDVLQSDLGMDEQQGTDAQGKPVTIPARCSAIYVKATPGTDLQKACVAIEEAIAKLDPEHRPDRTLVAQSWEQMQAMFLQAIEKEKILTTVLFGIISIVAIFLIFCIFFMIVVEKTRDIGIIKSVGASAGGVMRIFLGYGLAIGIVGAGLGLLAGYLVVHNINELHDWLRRAMGVTIWNPQVYAFDTIPNTMNPMEVTIIIAVAILSAVLGSLIPAVRAARLHPVEALRWE